MPREQFWRKSYDPGVEDLDSSVWERSYVDAIAPAFSQHPHKAACSYMGVEITFADLGLYANRFAHMLIANGMGKGDVVGINLPNIPAYLIAWLGALRAGCAVSGVSPLLSAEEMEHQLEDAGARALVTLDVIFDKRLRAFAARLPALKLVVCASVGDFLPASKRLLGRLLRKIPGGPVDMLPGKEVLRFGEAIRPRGFASSPPGVEVTPDDIAYVQYTGGTTGAPKGAVLTHRNAVSDLLLVQAWLGWERGGGVALSCFPLFHIAGLFFAANCIYLGWTQVLIPDPRNIDHVCKQLERYRPRMMANVPSLYHMLIAHPRFAKLDHDNLENCVSAAAPFPEESQRKLESIVGTGKLLEVYGMSETSPITIMNPSRGVKKLGSIGLPIINTDVKLLDPADGHEVGIGEPGEICVKGPMVMQRYHDKPEETRLAVDQDGYMHTGDVAVFDQDGYLRLVDRTKDMIIVSGFKVFSKTVEEVLSAHPAVDMVALVGVPNPERPGSELVKAFVVPAGGQDAAADPRALEEELVRYAREKLSPYECPKLIEIRDELPLTAVGKIDKKVLRREARG